MFTTLVLDSTYQPISAVHYTRALAYLSRDKAEVLENYDHQVHPDWQAPAVVRLTHWVDAKKHRVKFSRQNVLARDNWKCAYCSARKPTYQLTFDHVVPRSKGGKTEWENIVMACKECNAKKADKTLEQAGMKLRRPPYRPTWLPTFNMTLHQISNVPPEWRDYWTVELLP